MPSLRKRLSDVVRMLPLGRRSHSTPADAAGPPSAPRPSIEPTAGVPADGAEHARAVALSGPSSEDVFRSLLQLSSDWYWEQDENFRFASNPGDVPQETQHVGKTRWEMPYLGVSQAEWQAHRALLQAHKPFYDFEYLRAGADGSLRWMSVSGEPVFDEGGVFRGYRGIGKDITERKQAQQRQAIQYAVARHLSDAETLSAAIPLILRAFCRTMGWEYGARWTHREGEPFFECTETWYRPHLEHSAFLALSRTERYARGPRGLVRRVLETQEPYWILDIARDGSLQRARVAREAGLNAAFAFPITAGGRLLGVMEFFAENIWQPDLAIVETAKWVGKQIGQFIVRKQAEESYRELVDLSPDGILIYCDNRVVFANSASARLLGAEEAIQLLGRHVFELVHPQFRTLVEKELHDHLSSHTVSRRVEMMYQRLDGSPLHVEVSSRYFAFEDRPAVQAILRDVTERKAAERKIIKLSNLYAALSQTNKAITRLSDPQRLFEEVCRIVGEYGSFPMAGIMMIEPETRWVKPVATAGQSGTYLSSARLSIDPQLPEGRGLTGTAVRTGQHIICNDLTLDPRTLPWRAELLAAGLRSSGNFPLRRNGMVVGVLLLGASETNFFDPELIDLLVEMSSNISFALDAIDKESQRRQAEERLAFLAQYDVLTGLPNRSVFRDRLHQAVARARRNGTLVGMMFFDLDRFKQINDTLGHSTGDRVLQVVAARLKEQLREVDTISRLGGDEFTLIAEGAGGPEQFVSVAEKVRRVLSIPVEVDDRQIPISTSIGIAVYPQDCEDADTLLKNADIAMYRAKHEGRNTYLFYTPEMSQRQNDKLELEGQLRAAIDNDQLLIHYQPTVDIASGRIVGMEALVRWDSPQGMLLPTEFIPVAEETGIIVEIGAWLLKTACADAARWRKRNLPPLQLTVNLSARQFADKALPDIIADALRSAEGYPSDALTLEITESMILHQGEAVIGILERLCESGVRIAIDDFGTGYSSVAYLRRLPLHEVKIDPSFVKDIAENGDDAAIVKAMVAMAASLNIRVIAEGVETAEQLAVLRALQCDAFQGYLFSRPLPAEAFEALLKSQDTWKVGNQFA